MSHDLMSEQAALYALDALDGSERSGYEMHLVGCVACRSEVDSYHSTVAMLIPDEPASTEAWERLVREIDDVETVVDLHGRTTGSRHRRWVATIIAAAAVVMAGFLAGQLGQAGGDPSIVEAAGLAASEAGSIVGEFMIEDVSIARVVLTEDGRGYVIPTDVLPALDDTRTYQLWVINDTDEVISAGVLGFSPAPSTFTWTGDVTGFALTREVAGGVAASAGDVVAVITDI